MVWATNDYIQIFPFLLLTSNTASEFQKKVFQQGLSVPEELILSSAKLLPTELLVSGESIANIGVFVLQQPGTLRISNGYTVVLCVCVLGVGLCIYSCVCDHVPGYLHLVYAHAEVNFRHCP